MELLATNAFTSGRTYKIDSNSDYSAVGAQILGVIGDYFQATSTSTLGPSKTAYLVEEITGTKITYDDVINVNVPGTVKCKQKLESSQITEFGADTRYVDGSDVSNLSSKTQAFMEVIPPSEKKIKITVTESILTSIPTITQLAYNLDDINCSVTNKNL